MTDPRARRSLRVGGPWFPAFAAGVVLVTTLGVVCLGLAVRLIDRPFPGFLVYQYPSVGSFGGLDWAGVRAGMRYRDIVERVDGVRLARSKDLADLIARLPAGTWVRYDLRRGDASLDVQMPVSRFTSQDFFALFGLPFLATLVLAGIGVTVWVLKSEVLAGRLFSLFCLCLGVYLLTGLAAQSPPYSKILNAVNLVAMAFFPAAAVHLSLVFPEPTPLLRYARRVQLAPYAVSLILASALLADVAVLSRSHLSFERFVAVHADLVRAITASRVWAICAAGSLVVSAAWAFWRSRAAITRERARVVLLGCAGAFVPPVVTMPLVLAGALVLPFNFHALSVMAFPVAIGYAIARHNLFDVDRYLKRTVGYVIMTIAVGLTYLVTQTVVRTLVLEPLLGDAAKSLYPVVFALLVVCFFTPLQRRVQSLVDRLFFRTASDYKGTIRAVSRALTSLLDLEAIVRQVTGTIRTQMFAESAVVVLLAPDGGAHQAFVAAEGGAPGDRLEATALPPDEPLLALVRRERRLLTRYDIEEDPGFADVRGDAAASFARLDATLALPIENAGAVVAVLVLGAKKSGHVYTREDVELLDTMADEVGIALQNARAHERVVRYAEELAASLRRIQLLESMKANLAKFVPRTVQDLIERSPEAPLLEKREADVSVVFADITGYTRLSAELRMDEVNELVERYFGAFLDEIVRYGGDVNETAGDGLMVIFQDPDPAAHARAAVDAALGIQRRAREINAALGGRHAPVVMHVGVNSGPASVGVTRIEGVAGTRWTYTASGTTTNVAARLAALAEGGLVVISEETRRRIREDVKADVHDLGPKELKNVAVPVRAYALHEPAFETPPGVPGAEAA